MTTAARAPDLVIDWCNVVEETLPDLPFVPRLKGARGSGPSRSADLLAAVCCGQVTKGRCYHDQPCALLEYWAIKCDR